MKNTNPFVPQGSILEQQSKRRSRLKLVVFCALTVSVTGLTVLLIQGCKREQPTDSGTPQIDTNTVPLVDTNTSPVIDTNVPVTIPPTNFVQPQIQLPITQPPVEPTGSEYTIVKGDTLAVIAKKNHTTAKAIEAANPGVVPTKLQIGKKLIIPGGAAPVAPTAAADSTVSSSIETYTVKSGDTLTKIAKDHGTSVKAIQAENKMTTTTIYVGKKLKIPVKAAAVVPQPIVDPAPVAPAPVTPTTLPATVPAK